MTESDKSRQLTVAQRNAVDLLVLGKTDGEVAEGVGVTRQTVNEWRNHDSVFIAELNSQRQELWNSPKQHLRRLVSKAIQTLEDNLGAEDPALRQAAAVHVLKSTGLYGTQMEPGGPTNPEDVERGWEREAVSRKQAENMDRLAAQLVELSY